MCALDFSADKIICCEVCVAGGLGRREGIENSGEASLLIWTDHLTRQSAQIPRGPALHLNQCIHSVFASSEKNFQDFFLRDKWSSNLFCSWERSVFLSSRMNRRGGSSENTMWNVFHYSQPCIRRLARHLDGINASHSVQLGVQSVLVYKRQNMQFNESRRSHNRWRGCGECNRFIAGSFRFTQFVHLNMHDEATRTSSE